MHGNNFSQIITPEKFLVKLLDENNLSEIILVKLVHENNLSKMIALK